MCVDRSVCCCREPPEGRKGLGNIVVNGRPLDDYFKPILARLDAIAPFDVTATIGKYDVRATVTGGGVTGQAQVFSPLVPAERLA